MLANSKEASDRAKQEFLAQINQSGGSNGNTKSQVE